MPGGIGVPELAIILVIIVIIFGVGKLPEIGGALGKGIKEFKTESGVDEKGNKITKGASDKASTIAAASTEARDEVAAKSREIRAEEI